MKKCIKYLYCFNSFSAKKIEIITISISFFAIILTIIGLAIIHWEYTSRVMKTFYVLSLIFLLIFIFVSSLFLYLRIKQIHILTKNTKIIQIAIVICFLEFFLCIFSIFIHLFLIFGALPDLRKYNKGEDEQNNSNVSNGEFSFAIVSLIFNIFIWIVNLLLCISEFIRIKEGIDGSYNVYLQEKYSEENAKKDLNIIIDQSQYENTHIKKKEDILPDKLFNKKENGINSPLKDLLDNDDKCNANISDNKHNLEQKNILRYSYKEKHSCKNYNSLDDARKEKNDKFDKEKFFDKYLEGGGANPFYSNFGNRSLFNGSTMFNSLNPEN